MKNIILVKKNVNLSMSVYFVNFYCININEIILIGKEWVWNVLLISIRCII